MTHAPYRRVLDAMTTEGCDVVLAGHTHGGQVCVPFVGALVTNCDLPRRYAKGLHRWQAGDRASWLHVSAGVGTSPVRADPVRVPAGGDAADARPARPLSSAAESVAAGPDPVS